VAAAAQAGYGYAVDCDPKLIFDSPEASRNSFVHICWGFRASRCYDFKM
jgi:hypothetical protein